MYWHPIIMTHVLSFTGSVRRRSPVPASPPYVAALQSLTRGEGAYMASNHNDSAPGAVHCFLDEHGE